MKIPGTLMARLGSCEQTIIPIERWADELDFKINLCMKDLYREGYRRFRVVPIAKHGDVIRRLVMGWPE